MSVGFETLRRTPLHVAAEAKLVPFVGWHMPVQCAGIREEHLTIRRCATPRAPSFRSTSAASSVLRG
jgi:hypothetical protein